MEAYRLSWRMVFPAVFRVLRNREEAEDIMQEAYIKGFRRLRELRDPEKYVGWQKQIAVRQALNRLRQLRPESVLPTDVLQLPEEEESWPLVDHDILRQAVAMLPDGYRISV
ncbi:MAG: RNA polymerase sigma factor, partial [Phycisphaerae bacterium]